MCISNRSYSIASIEEIVFVLIVLIVRVVLLSEGLLDVAIGQSVEQQIGSQFLVLITGNVGLCGLDLAETQCSQLLYIIFTLFMAYSSCWETMICPSWFSTSSPSP